jgi:hypothetical protein
LDEITEQKLILAKREVWSHLPKQLTVLKSISNVTKAPYSEEKMNSFGKKIFKKLESTQ